MTRLVWRRWVGRQPTGIDRVCLAYLDRYRSNAQAVVQHRRGRRILDSAASAVLFDILADPRRTFRGALIGAALRHGLRRACEARQRLYLNVGHTGLNDPGFRTWVRDSGVRAVYFVHDLIPITHPEFCRAGEAQKHRERMRTVLSTGIGVIANSRVTLEDLAGFARDEQLASVPAVAAALGSNAIPALPTLKDPGPPTFVILGTIEGRKNHLMLLHLWTRLIERMGSHAPRLLVIGQRGWECQEVFDLLDRSTFLQAAVTEIGKCDDQALAQHLARARALLFPSLVEGYGLPLAEALRSGVPVIASDLAVFREIAGEVPHYLDPLDASAWERTILAYASDDSPERNEQLRRLSGYQPPIWGDHFDRVNSWLATLA